jgi:hypothetical protein
LHAVPIGQSAATLQPHAPPMHAWPAALALQSKQATPLPQAVEALPARQLPIAQQPLHGCMAEQANTH